MGGAVVSENKEEEEEAEESLDSGATSGGDGGGGESGNASGDQSGDAGEDDEGANAQEAEVGLHKDEEAAGAETGGEEEVGDGDPAVGDEAGRDRAGGAVTAPPGPGEESEKADLSAGSEPGDRNREPEIPPAAAAAAVAVEAEVEAGADKDGEHEMVLHGVPRTPLGHASTNSSAGESEEHGVYVTAANSVAGDGESAGAGEGEDEEASAIPADAKSSAEGEAGTARGVVAVVVSEAEHDGTSAAASEESAAVTDEGATTGAADEGAAPTIVAGEGEVAGAVTAGEIAEEEIPESHRGRDDPAMPPGHGSAGALVEDGVAVADAADTADHETPAKAGVGGDVTEPKDTAGVATAAAADPGKTAGEALGLAARSGLLLTDDLPSAVVTSHEACRAYRNGRTFHIKVSAETPRYVWLPPPSPPPSPVSGGRGLRRGRGPARGRAGSRAAPLRISHITWDRSVFFYCGVLLVFLFRSMCLRARRPSRAASSRLPVALLGVGWWKHVLLFHAEGTPQQREVRNGAEADHLRSSTHCTLVCSVLHYRFPVSACGEPATGVPPRPLYGTHARALLVHRRAFVPWKSALQNEQNFQLFPAERL